MSYKHDMSGEDSKSRLIPEGERTMQINNCIESVSKSGNEMFIFTFMDLETFIELDVYAIATKGKRWFLKSVLDACGVSAGKDGIYEWDIKDVIDKTVSAIIKHEPNNWVNQKGETIESKKMKVVKVSKVAESAKMGLTIPF